MFATRQEPMGTRSEETPAEADDMVLQSEGEWVMQEPKIPPSAYFLYAAEEKQRMPKTLCKTSAREIQNGWSKMDSDTKAEFETRASQLRMQYQVQLREYKQCGRFRLTASDSSGHGKSAMTQTKPGQTLDENKLEITAGQLEAFMDSFANNIKASYDLDPGRCQQIVDSFKVAFQNPDKEAASFTKAQFQKIREALGDKLASAVAEESLAKASQSSQHP